MSESPYDAALRNLRERLPSLGSRVYCMTKHHTGRYLFFSFYCVDPRTSMIENITREVHVVVNYRSTFLWDKNRLCIKVNRAYRFEDVVETLSYLLHSNPLSLTALELE